MKEVNRKIIVAAQVASLALMWIFVIGIGTWIANLLRLSAELRDVPSVSVAISIVAIPIFATIAGVLTYVFVGLRRALTTENMESSQREEPK